MNIQTFIPDTSLQVNKGDLIELVENIRNKQFRDYLLDQISNASTKEEIAATSMLIAVLVVEPMSLTPS